jgi:hypothetical protein
MLNNREIAIIVWITLFFLFAFLKEKLRASFYQLAKITFSRFILGLIASMLTYVFVMVLIFQKIGFWDASALKDTAAWTCGVAFVMLFNVNKAGDEDLFFQRALASTLGLAVVFEFIANMYTFSLPVELVMLPIVTMLAMMRLVAGLKPESKRVESGIGYILSAIGTLLTIVLLRKAIVDFHNLATLHNLRDFLLPPIFTLAFVPYIYGLALFMKYESIFNRIDFVNDDTSLIRYAKRRIVIFFHINLKKLSKWSGKAGILRFGDRDEILARLKRPALDEDDEYAHLSDRYQASNLR